MSTTEHSTSFFGAVPDAIAAASKSPLGILALCIVVIGFLAYVYFGKASSRIRIIIFSELLLGVALYASAVFRVLQEPGTNHPAEASFQTANNPSSTAAIRSQVIDDDGFPLENVSVSSSDGTPALTDSNGEFELQVQLAPGQMRSVLTFAKKGYLPKSVSFVLPDTTGRRIQLLKPTVQTSQPPDYRAHSEVQAETPKKFSVTGIFQQGYRMSEDSEVTIDITSGRESDAHIGIIGPDGKREDFTGRPNYNTDRMWQWQNQGSLGGSLDFQDQQHAFVSYPGGYTLSNSAFYTPSLGHNVTSSNTVFSPLADAASLPPVTLKGLVVSEDLERLPSVSVVSSDTSSVTTDSDGRFELTFRAQKGQTMTTLIFSKAGFTPKKITTDIPSANALEVELRKVHNPFVAAEQAANNTSDKVCRETKDLRALGWRSGNKGNFCRSRGYDGNWNPSGRGYRDYRDGGLCFKGDASACYAAVGCTRDTC
jgi:hypothetical protein